MALVSLQQQVKIWLFPALMSILAALIWHDVNEVRLDVKALMAQSNIDKTRIDTLERAVYSHNSIPVRKQEDNKTENNLIYTAVKPDEKYYLAARTNFKRK